MNEDLAPVIIEALNDLIEQQVVEVSNPPDRDTPLFGDGGILDSMSLVTLVVDVEQAIEDQLGVSVALADAKAMSQTNSPYRTIGSLADYAGKVIAEGA